MVIWARAALEARSTMFMRDASSVFAVGLWKMVENFDRFVPSQDLLGANGFLVSRLAFEYTSGLYMGCWYIVQNTQICFAEIFIAPLDEYMTG
jgi:hypothetical protein